MTLPTLAVLIFWYVVLSKVSFYFQIATTWKKTALPLPPSLLNGLAIRKRTFFCAFPKAVGHSREDLLTGKCQKPGISSFNRIYLILPRNTGLIKKNIYSIQCSAELIKYKNLWHLRKSVQNLIFLTISRLFAGAKNDPRWPRRLKKKYFVYILLQVE